MKDFVASAKHFFKPWFHKRNLIIVSEHKVKHIHVSGRTQFILLAAAVGSVCWASYSTGSFLAARSVLKEQSQTLRSVANARVESKLNPLAQVSRPAAAATTAADDAPMIVSATEPLVTPTALSNNKLYARIAFLERKVTELKTANEEIIQRVHSKTAGHIDDLESIIRQTGLNTEDLKKQVTKSRRSEKSAEGGPYIPVDMAKVSTQEIALYHDLDTLAVLREVVRVLPLSHPVEQYDEQSTFGHRIDPFTGHLAFHSGLDMAAPAGAEIHSTAPGRVIAAGWNGAYGNAVDVDHGFGITTRYGHLSQISVKEGQAVKKGEVLGIQGSTGRSTGPHVHYEVRYNDQPMNPKNFIEAGNHVSEE